MQVSGRHFTNGDYERTSQVHNNRPVYKNNNWCIFYGGHWKIEGCAWLAKGDNSQGIGWSRVEAACPADIGAQWSYFKWGVGGRWHHPWLKIITKFGPSVCLSVFLSVFLTFYLSLCKRDAKKTILNT